MESVNKGPSWDLNPRWRIRVCDFNCEAMLRGKTRSISTAPKAMSAVGITIIIKILPFLHSPHQPAFLPKRSLTPAPCRMARKGGCQIKTLTPLHVHRDMCITWTRSETFGLSEDCVCRGECDWGPQGQAAPHPAPRLASPALTAHASSFPRGSSSQSAGSWLLPRGNAHRQALQVNQFVAGFSLEAGLPPLNSLIVWQAPFCVLSHRSIRRGQAAVPDLDLQQLVWLPSCSEACPLVHVSSARDPPWRRGWAHRGGLRDAPGRDQTQETCTHAQKNVAGQHKSHPRDVTGTSGERASFRAQACPPHSTPPSPVASEMFHRGTWWAANGSHP